MSSPEVEIAFAADLAEEMERRSLKPLDVAYHARVSVPTVYAWLKGESEPEYRSYLRLCEMFDWPHRELDPRPKKSPQRRKKQATRAKLHADSLYSPILGIEGEGQSPDPVEFSLA